MRLCKNTIDLDFSYIGAVVEISPEWRQKNTAAASCAITASTNGCGCLMAAHKALSMVSILVLVDSHR